MFHVFAKQQCVFQSAAFREQCRNIVLFPVGGFYCTYGLSAGRIQCNVTVHRLCERQQQLFKAFIAITCRQ